MELGIITEYTHLGDAWREITSKENFEQCTFLDMGLGDTCISMLEYKDGTFEVGQGEALRPYIQHYIGTDVAEALKAFIKGCTKLLC